MFDFCVKNSENSEKMKKGETMAMEKKQQRLCLFGKPLFYLVN